MWLDCREASESNSQHSPQAKYPSVYETAFAEKHRLYQFNKECFSMLYCAVPY